MFFALRKILIRVKYKNESQQKNVILLFLSSKLFRSLQVCELHVLQNKDGSVTEVESATVFGEFH